MKKEGIIIFVLLLAFFAYVIYQKNNGGYYKLQYLELLKKTSTCDELRIENEELTHEILDQKAHIEVLRGLVNSKLK